MPEMKYGVYKLLNSHHVHFTDAEELPRTDGYGELVSTHASMDEAQRAAGLLPDQSLATKKGTSR